MAATTAMVHQEMLESMFDSRRYSAAHFAPICLPVALLIVLSCRRRLHLEKTEHVLQRHVMGRCGAVLAVQRPGVVARLKRARYLFWAVAVGTSVTLRLWSSVRIVDASALDPFLASIHIAAASSFLSALCLIPFASWSSRPRGLGPWLSGLCTLPSGSLIVASQALGLGLVQMFVKLSTLATALILDGLGGHSKDGLRQRLVGVGLVLGGVALSMVGSTTAFPAAASSGMSLLPLYVVGCLASGTGYVLQARLSVAPHAAGDAEKQPAPGAAASAAIACQVASAAAQAVTLALLWLRGMAVDGSFCMRPRQAHLWLLAGLQGAFYVQSLQALPARVGYSATFALCLCGQLISAVVIDAIQKGVLPCFNAVAGLAIVVLGASISGMAGSSSSHDDGDCEAPTDVKLEGADASSTK